MDRIEKLIKGYLKDDLKLSRNSRTGECLSELDVLNYLAGTCDEETLQIWEHHIAACGYCLNQLNIAFTAAGKEIPRASCLPSGLINKTKSLLDVPKNSRNYGRIVRENLFLIGTIGFFLLSFVIPRYFIQFLVAALILGGRWALESESGRTFIMVLDSWRRSSHDKNDEISRRLTRRF